MAKNKPYKRKTKKERECMFSELGKKLGHAVINIEPPKDKEQIKLARQSSRLSGSQAAVVCGVSRRSWTAWENKQTKEQNGKKIKEAYPSDWQWGWFLLATNQHPTLQLVKKAESKESAL